MMKKRRKMMMISRIKEKISCYSHLGKIFPKNLVQNLAPAFCAMSVRESSSGEGYLVCFILWETMLHWVKGCRIGMFDWKTMKLDWVSEWLFHLLVVWHWASSLASFCLSTLTYKGIITVPTYISDLLRKVNELIFVKHLKQWMEHDKWHTNAKNA